MAKWYLNTLARWKHHTKNGVGYGVTCSPCCEGVEAEHLWNTFVLSMERKELIFGYPEENENGDWFFVCHGPGLLFSEEEMNDYERRLTKKRAEFLLEMLRCGQRFLDALPR